MILILDYVGIQCSTFYINTFWFVSGSQSQMESQNFGSKHRRVTSPQKGIRSFTHREAETDLVSQSKLSENISIFGYVAVCPLVLFSQLAVLIFERPLLGCP